MSSYRPFVDDPDDIARFDGYRFVVLRATGAVANAHGYVRSLVKGQITHPEAAFLPQAHVTLAGFPKGTNLESVRDLVAEWAQSVAPLQIEVEKVGYFAAPFKIVILQIHETTALCDALVSLRDRATARGLDEGGMVRASDWIFHMSVSYCAPLSDSEWTAVTEFVEGLSVPAARCVVGEVEVVAVDNGQERSSVFDLSGKEKR